MRTSRSVVRSSDLGCLISGFCSSGRGFAPRFLQTPPRGDALALRSHFTSIRLCRGLAPPGCRTCSAHDQTGDGRRLKILPVVDEYTRECLAIEVERGLTAEDVVSTLEYLFEVRGEPAHIRSDNGPEFIAEVVKGWLARRGAGTLYIEPGSPRENAYSETFNSRLRDELLDREVFESLKEAKVLLEDHRLEYNHRRPHSSWGIGRLRSSQRPVVGRIP